MSTLIYCATLQAVGLRGYAQRDPLVEYKLEGYNLFLDMMAQIRRNTIYNVYQFDPTKVTSCRPHPHPQPGWWAAMPCWFFVLQHGRPCACRSLLRA